MKRRRDARGGERRPALVGPGGGPEGLPGRAGERGRPTPKAILSEAGTVPLEMTGFIEMGLRAVYEGNGAAFLKARRGGQG